MTYIEIYFPNISEARGEIITALLSSLPFDSFRVDQGCSAYIPKEHFLIEDLKSLIKASHIQEPYQIIEHPKENWNKKWEEHIEPILIENSCYIRCDFHPPKKNIPHQIIINPKMSFGTGHHQTTRLMIRALLQINCADKLVLDMGCGTGVLGILGLQKKAKDVHFIDIDNWAIQNTLENIELNHLHRHLFSTTEGGKEKIDRSKKYDIILSNITKNSNLELIETYQSILATGGHLLLSGFYEKDCQDILVFAQQFGLKFQNQNTENSWACLHLIQTHT